MLMHEIGFACNKKEVGICINEIIRAEDENKETINVVDLDSSYAAIAFHKAKIIGFSRNEDNKFKKNGAVCVEFFHRPFLICDFVDSVLKYVNEDNSKKDFSSIPDIKPEKIILNKADFSVNYLGNRIRLSENEFEILYCLNEHRNETVTRSEINGLLGGEHGNMSDVYICRLRSKLSKYSNENLIHTVRKNGYMLKI